MQVRCLGAADVVEAVHGMRAGAGTMRGPRVCRKRIGFSSLAFALREAADAKGVQDGVGDSRRPPIP